MKQISAFSCLCTLLYVLSSSWLFKGAAASARDQFPPLVDIPGASSVELRSFSNQLRQYENRNSEEGHLKKWIGELNDEFNQFKDIKFKEIEKTEKQKEEAWDHWLTVLEPEWVTFSNFIEQKKKRWIQKKEEDWSIWIKDMEHKWVNYKKKKDRKYLSKYRDGTLNCSEREWNVKMKREVEAAMIADYKKWMRDAEENLQKWISKDLDIWKKKKFDEWLKVEWKKEEDAHWSKDSNTPYGDTMNPLFSVLKKSYDMYTARKKREKEHWNKLTENIGKTLTNKKYVDWENMKMTKSGWYNEWMDFFLQQCLNSKVRKHRSHRRRSESL
ncbi:tryptophan-rich antigen [Plasmodium vivax]|uniref:Tryptophan-rich protein n=1 Tax=Plasmodium vivax TaxID=5855 RepID=A0A564ZQF4_PLAVI|nr:tryptophan-rich antigen [Plasmodium vivax]